MHKTRNENNSLMSAKCTNRALFRFLPACCFVLYNRETVSSVMRETSNDLTLAGIQLVVVMSKSPLENNLCTVKFCLNKTIYLFLFVAILTFDF